MVAAPCARPPDPPQEGDELRGLALAIREGLLLIVRYIEWRYGKEQAPRRRAH